MRGMVGDTESMPMRKIVIPTIWVRLG
ncbi:hypothetical protein TIFTF001_056683 [Ficus carica]|uniref:Uncharacterized protein n=1 Tax=Ficus carica TaxID=3494 RepID=A0AA88JJW8_FICCA|nr:hypothetical protein TIFTF001_056680 [Ficus carica]GMN75340.1 hypothetical protein TIFTF001_056681 [Ficus carica]GMN75343.1 hypothetical protein TIFTF001_056682 [Ficus carica]GMN75346.1 hypothetical protein TIFTF001_056683 [Ficus carica]